MNILVKTVRAGQLPDGWQVEMGLAPDSQVLVKIEEVHPSRSREEIEAVLEKLRQLKPIAVDGDVTTFMRSERDRLDGRNSR